MTNLHSGNSKLMNPKKKLYSLIDVNLFLLILGILPLGRVPTSKIIINFLNDKLSVAIQPVEIWRTEILTIPDYDRFSMNYEESLFPYTKLMHFDIEFHFPDGMPKTMVTKKKLSTMHKMDKALLKRGSYLDI